MIFDLGAKILGVNTKKSAASPKPALPASPPNQTKPAKSPKPAKPAKAVQPAQSIRPAPSPAPATNLPITPNQPVLPAPVMLPTTQPPQTGQIALIPGMSMAPPKRKSPQVYQFKTLWESFAGLRRGTSSQQNQLTTLKQEVQSLQLDLGSVRAEVEIQTQQLVTLARHTNNLIESVREEIKTRITQTRELIITVGEKVNELGRQVEAIRLSQSRLEADQKDLQLKREQLEARWQRVREELTPLPGQQRQDRERIQRLETDSKNLLAQVKSLRTDTSNLSRPRFRRRNYPLTLAAIATTIILMAVPMGLKSHCDTMQRAQVSQMATEYATFRKIRSLQNQLASVLVSQINQQTNLNTLTRSLNGEWTRLRSIETRLPNPNPQPPKRRINTDGEIVVPGPNARYEP